MYNSKFLKLVWIAVSLIAIFAMVFFTILPAFY